MNMAKHLPAAFAFIKYADEQSAWKAIEELNNTYLWETRISVQEANKQHSYFTQDTGFITNEEFDVPRPPPPDFDSSLPETHYQMKRKQELSGQSNVYSIRVNDLPPEIT
jgi:RNA recognition motif-containing protein